MNGQEYRVFTKNTNHEEAKKYFYQLFGYEPETCQEWHDLLWVGPIKEY